MILICINWNLLAKDKTSSVSIVPISCFELLQERLPLGGARSPQGRLDVKKKEGGCDSSMNFDDEF